MSPAKRCLVAIVSLLLFAVIAFFDIKTGKEFSFTLLYLAPISISIWFVGPALSLGLCFLAAVGGVFDELMDGATPSAALWNAGIRLGIYLLFYALLDYLREHKPSVIRANRTRKWIAVAALIPCAALVGVCLLQNIPADGGLRAAAAASRNDTVAEVNPLAELASLVEESMKASRPLLLGSRDPNGPSCVRTSRTGDVKDVMPSSQGDMDGGPGTSLAVLFFLDRQSIKSPLADFKWHQTRFRQFLENNVSRGSRAEELIQRAVAKTRDFLAAADAWPTLPKDVTSIDFTRRDDWPSYCIASLNGAIRDKDLAEVRHWARELAAATFWLEDLLRWRNFLFKNYLAALDFQARCESLFASAEFQHTDYNPNVTISQFPAGVLELNSHTNNYEVERQAERLFCKPDEPIVEMEHRKHATLSSVWMPPGARDAFLQLRSVLSPDNQWTWDQAARTPYEHGYLANTLFRARTAESLDDLQAVLKKFDARNPHANINDLMDVIMYRGHSFAGLEWGDRFQPKLTAAAEKITPGQNDTEALRAAWEWTNQFYKPENYGLTFTLRDALERQKLDCVRATDMIAAIFRNAGRARMGHVRWCSETGAHSVAAYLGPDEPRSKPHLADGLTAPREPEVWPDCYFHGHAWPPGMESNQPPYAMELYTRGIDSYVWTEGYIIMGASAGFSKTVAIPYSKQFASDSARKINDGPESK